ncbi:hypothetical protein RA28_05475 [Ruegeria sp. ANG-S4]|uniref:hypothetical protein n=1 Tax=Ruegeria sp. ANG-S4 TaxID=1577904 RepID=UPI00057C7365|nr:hypothetical protein [Ruegeria sp. ANG-S4]KIC47140.1 hypothetical protein RA28_05475 [Ruegeria sp. ANG-S4]
MKPNLKQTAFTVLVAGAFATIAFDVFGQALSPLFGFSKLAPVGLAGASINAIFGVNPPGAAYLLHTLTGLVFYALGWALIARPLQRAVVPKMPWIATALLYGVILWVFALYVMAHLVTGNAPFLGWTGITYVALYGHIVYAIVAAWIMEARGLKIDLPFAHRTIANSNS